MSKVEGNSGSNTQIWIRLAVGAALLLTPWLYKFNHLNGPTTSAWVAGAVLIALAVAGLRVTHPAIMWVQTAVGVWLAFAPWTLKFTNQAMPTQIHVIVGALLVGMAARAFLRQRFGSGAATS